MSADSERTPTNATTAAPSGDGDAPATLPPSRKGRATRQALLAAARAVIAREGFLNAKVATIAEAAGKSEASFYNYFESKEALLVEIASDFEHEMDVRTAEAFRAGRPEPEALREAIQTYWDIFRARLGEIVGVFQASMVDERFAAQWQEIRAMAVRRIARGIEAAQAQGYAPGLQPQLAASALASMVDYFAYVWLAQDGDVIDEDFSDEAAVETLWTLWSHAIYWTGGDGAARPGERGER